jgi:hypothetical protein
LCIALDAKTQAQAAGRFFIPLAGLMPLLPMNVAFFPAKHEALAQFVLLPHFGHFGAGRGGYHRQEMVTNRRLLIREFKPTTTGIND